MKTAFPFLLFFTVLMDGAALPSIPGCPLHDSCVRALQQEQRRRQRELRQREAPDAGEAGAAQNSPGLLLGFQIDGGDSNDKTNDYINLRPSLAYLNGLGNLDIFLCAFYTLSLDDPGLWPVGQKERLAARNRYGFEANAAYNFDAGGPFSFALGLDARNQFTVSPGGDSEGGENLFSYAALEPAFKIGYDVDWGDFSAGSSFPFTYAGAMALDYTVSAAVNTVFGFGLALTSRFWNLRVDRESEYGRTNPAFQYGETELILNYWDGPFFASLALTADAAFRQFSVEPYLSYRIKRITLFAGLLFNNLGPEGNEDEIRLNLIQGKRDVSGVIPSLGLKYRF